jgi:adenine-specific DNA-methyltransferase
MDKLKLKTHGQSVDLVAENIMQIQRLFPSVFTEGKIDFDVLRSLLGDNVDDYVERYRLMWRGKDRVRRIAQGPTSATLRPTKNDSANWDSTRNIFIEGDNLEVLKLLQKSYHRKAKLVYVDPPYNTGRDIIYPGDNPTSTSSSTRETRPCSRPMMFDFVRLRKELAP